ncbi:YpoC family protein [Peribacillus sp. NPDC060253]|uniref:YpoC family protein n=1 Tax=Peribacillus sp. NPDC060253 TaxID=3347084 RepID=UPI003655FE26
MTQFISLKVPAELEHLLFFPEKETILENEHYKRWSGSIPFESFPYELLYYNNVESYAPWTKGAEHVKELLDKWKEIDSECSSLFSERKVNQTSGLMKQGISLFLTAVFWMHGRPVILSSLQRQIESLKDNPVNLAERLSFIIARPAFFHSYRQLSELFQEFEKQYAKYLIKNKNSKKNV